MESKDEKRCHQCPCTRTRTECSEFQKLVDLSDAGVVIYRHSTRDDEAIYLTSDFEMGMTNTDVFIVHNTKDAEVTSADIVPALVQNKVDCPRCQNIMNHAQRLLQNVSIVDKQEVIGICDHCKMKGKYRPCVDCTKVVKKFMTSVHIRGDYEETKERLKTWLKKIQTMLTGVPSDKRGLKVKSRSQTDLRIDKLRQYSERVVHVPDVEQMFKPEKYRPTSSKGAPGSKSVYFKELDEKLLIDTESAVVERTGKEDFVQAEKATVGKEHVPKTKEFKLSSDQIILDQKKPDTIAIVSKTQPVDEIKTISSSTVAITKLPKDLNVEVSKINAIKSEKSKSQLTRKGALIKSKRPESRLRAQKYHSEDDLTINIGDVHVQESKIPKKGFKYFFPKEAKAKRPRSDLTSSVLIKDTQDKIKDEAEKKKAEARKRKAEENEKKTVAKEKKRAKMDEQKAKPVEAPDPAGKKVKADGKKVKSDGENVKADGTKEISKQPEVGREPEVSRPAKTEDSLPLESKGELKSKSQTKESPTDIILQERISKEPKTEIVDSVKSVNMEKQKSPDKRSDDKQNAIPKDATGSKKQDAPLKDKNSKIKEKSEQGAPLNDTDSKIKEKLDKKGEKSDRLSKAKDEKQKQTETDVLKKALASQQRKPQDTKQKPQQEKELKEAESKIRRENETESKIKREKETTPKVLKDKLEENKKGKKENNGTSDGDKSKKDKEEMTLLKKALDKQSKEKDEELKMKKKQEEAEKKARDLATKIAKEAPKTLDTTYVPPSSELRTESEESAFERVAPTTTMKDLDMKDIQIRKPSYDDLILRLVKLKKAAAKARQNRALGQPAFGDLMFSTANTVRHKGHLRKVDNCEFCLDSDLELDLDSYFKRREIEEQAVFAEMILGDKIIKKTHKPPMKKEKNIEPALFMSAFDELADKIRPGTVPKVVFEEEPPHATVLKSRAAVSVLTGQGVKLNAFHIKQSF